MANPRNPKFRDDEVGRPQDDVEEGLYYPCYRFPLEPEDRGKKRGEEEENLFFLRKGSLIYPILPNGVRLCRGETLDEIPVRKTGRRIEGLTGVELLEEGSYWQFGGGGKITSRNTSWSLWKND